MPQRFQDEAKNGYPMLEMARVMMHGDSPITDAEARLRRLSGSPGPGSEQSDKA